MAESEPSGKPGPSQASRPSAAPPPAPVSPDPQLPNPNVAAAATHEVDTEPDADSALGEEEQSDTSSLASTILRHRQELGRTYHKFRGGENDYYAPNDEQQNDQLDIGHHMLTLLLANRLYLAPIDEANCRNVLDLGTGTGIWAIDFADSHPDADVTGIDLSPIQPSWLPPNCHFIIDDITNDWAGPKNRYDFVNIRCLYACIADWPALFRQAYDHIAPGGWVQSMEIDIQFASDDGTLPPDHVMLKWSEVFIASGVKMGKTFKVAEKAHQWIEEADFENVQSQWFKVPVGPWPKDKAMKEVGLWNYHYCYEGCEGWALYLLTHILGWSMEETQVLVAQFRNACRDKKTHAYYGLNVVWGQKPLNPPTV